MSSFTDFCADFFKNHFELHPTEAIYYGIEGYDQLLNDYSDEAYDQEKAFAQESLKRLRQISVKGLTKDETIDYALMEGRVTIEERRREAWQAALRADATDRRLGGGIRARAKMALAPAGDGATTLTVDTDLTILGKIGEFGQPVIKKKADALLQEFAANIRAALAP